MNSADTLRWFKSSYSDGGGGQCLEVAYAWRKSTYSDSGGGDCVEIAPCFDATDAPAVHIRDSKTPAGDILTVSATTWSGFLARVRV
ncbi:DUF397 domain-containing protein [Streptomyces sp. NPDC047072]|uniref:DUF397 domain-containing protein n=1 Tax=Streptomyces sp. NPDC047072 TaxID=3154809 RepID=UPI0033F289BF